MFYLTLLAMAVGAALVFLGWRGRRIGQEPRCRWCRFDLSGTYPEAELCPECGAGLHAKRGPTPVVHGIQRRRWVMACLGLLLLIGASPMFTSFASQWIQFVDLRPHMPLWALQQEATSSNRATAAEALIEIQRRIAAGKLSTRELCLLADRALDAQADRASEWYAATPTASSWAAIFEDAWAAGALTDEQRVRFARQALDLSVAAPNSVELGGEWALAAGEGESRICPNRPASLFIQITKVEAGGKVLFETPISATRGVSGGGGLLRAANPELRFTQFAPMHVKGEGVLDAKVTAQVWYFDGPGGSAAPLLHSWPVTLHKKVNVVAPGTELVKLTTNPALRQRMRLSLLARQPIRIFEGDESPFMWSALEATDPPMDVAFDAFLRSGEKEWPVGSFCFRAGERRVEAFGDRQFPLNGLTAPQVDLVLRPSPGAAAKHHGDIKEIWGEEIVYPGLATQMIGQRRAAPGGQ